jgi:PHD/YefM family antitoxin component YafN of YafNO toxin-antitoxin module
MPTYPLASTPMFKINEIYPIEDFRADPDAIIAQAKSTGRPIILTVNGRAELVLQNADAYQALLDELDQKPAELHAADRRELESPEEGSPSKEHEDILPEQERRTRARPFREAPGQLVRRSFSALSDQPEIGNEITGTDPLKIEWPDGSETDIRHWKDLAVIVIRWLGERHELPDAFSGRTRSGKKYLINVQPCHADGTKFDENDRLLLDVAGQRRWVDTKRSAWDTVRCLTRLVEELDEEPDRFVVWFRTTY